MRNNNLLRKIRDQIAIQSRVNARTGAYQALIRKEAVIGGKLFGPLQAGHRREFFCLDENTWIWHEEWLDQKNTLRIVNTRYVVRPDGIIKTLDGGQSYQALTIDEARNLRDAANLYNKRVMNELYSQVF